MAPKRNILIFHQAALGDFVLTWPVAMALSRVFAQSRVMYVTAGDKGRLAEHAIGVESVDAEAGWSALYGDGLVTDAPADPPADPPADVRAARLLAGAQCVVLFAQNPEPKFVANVTAAAGEVAFFHLAPNPPPGVHVFDHQLAQFEHVPPMQAYVRQMQGIVRERGLVTATKPRRGVLIHPGSGSPAKNWPVASFVRVAEKLTAAGTPVQFVVGEVERERFPAADLAALAAAAPVSAPGDLLDLRRLLAGAAHYVGNDSGPTHLAAALGTPTHVLHGPATDWACWKPVGPRVTDSAFDATPDGVAAAVVGGLSAESP